MQDHFLGVGKPRSIQGLFCLTHVVHDDFHGTFRAGRCEQKPKDIHFCMAKHFGDARQSSGTVFAVNGKLIHFWHGPYPLSPAFYIHENAVSAQGSQLREDDSSHVLTPPRGSRHSRPTGGAVGASRRTACWPPRNLRSEAATTYI